MITTQFETLDDLLGTEDSSAIDGTNSRTTVWME